jgi:hypothetical protein
VADEKSSVNWRQVASDFVHNTLFSFAVGPFINGMSSAINGNGYWRGVKAVAGSWRGWKFNAELALAVGSIATTVNLLMGRSYKTTDEKPASAPSMPPIPSGEVRSDHSAREEARREQPQVDAGPRR